MLCVRTFYEHLLLALFFTHTSDILHTLVGASVSEVVIYYMTNHPKTQCLKTARFWACQGSLCVLGQLRVSSVSSLPLAGLLTWPSRLPGPGPGQPEHVLMAAAEKQEGSRSSYGLCQALCASALPLSCDRSSHAATPRSVLEPQSMWVQGGRTRALEGSPAATGLCLGLFLRAMVTLCPIAWGHRPFSRTPATSVLCCHQGGACSKHPYLPIFALQARVSVG